MARRGIKGNAQRPNYLAIVLMLFAFHATDRANAQLKDGVELVPHTPHGDQIEEVLLTSDGTRVVTIAVQEKSVKIWDLQSRRLIRTIDILSLGLQGRPDITPDGRYIAAVHTSGALHIIESENGQFVRAIGSDLGAYPGVKITPDGRRVITARQDGILQLWDFESGELKLQFGDVTA